MAAGILMRNRSGFTLVEVLVALVLLGLGIASAQALITDRLAGSVVRVAQHTTAAQLADEQIEHILADPGYAQLEVRYNTAGAVVPGFSGFMRSTRVDSSLSTGGKPRFKTITVRVWGATLSDTVSRTSIRSHP